MASGLFDRTVVTAVIRAMGRSLINNRGLLFGMHDLFCPMLGRSRMSRIGSRFLTMRGRIRCSMFGRGVAMCRSRA